MTLKGAITISRTHRGDGKDSIRIEIVDGSSRVHFLVGEMSLSDFASAITGLGYQPIDLEVRGLDKLGMKREHKSERIAWTGFRVRDAFTIELAKATIAPYEIDGWRGQYDDLFNSHKRIVGSNDLYSVGFHRYVAADAAGEES